MTIRNIVDPNGVKVNGRAITEGMTVSESDLVETTNSTSSVNLMSDGQKAATVSGASSAITTFTPPTISLDHIFYNHSYRYKLRTPSGNVGIRG